MLYVGGIIIVAMMLCREAHILKIMFQIRLALLESFQGLLKLKVWYQLLEMTLRCKFFGKINW